MTLYLGMPVSACTVAGALEEMKEASDSIPTLKEHITGSRANPSEQSDQSKTEHCEQFRDGTLWHTRVQGAERSLKAGAWAAAFLSPGPLSMLSSRIRPGLLAQSGSFSSVVPKNPFQDSLSCY